MPRARVAELRGIRLGDIAAVAAHERDRRGRPRARSSQPARRARRRGRPAARRRPRRARRSAAMAAARCAKWCFHSTRPSGRTRELRYTPRSAAWRDPPRPNASARSTSSSRERPVGGAREELADLRRTGVRVDPRRDVDDDELADEIGAGCRDRRRGEPAERLPDEQLRAVGPGVDARGDVGGEDSRGVGGSLAPRGVAVPGQVDRERGQARARGSWCPTCAR